MLATAYTGSTDLSLVEIDPEDPGVGEVRIAVAWVGLCGTDLHVLHGAMDHRVTTPHVLGHEMSGVIQAVGEEVKGWDIGDRVTVMPLRWDGTCPACIAGHSHICHNLDFMGVDAPGALQQQWVVPAETLVRLPESIELRDAALIEPTAVAVHDVRRSALRAGERAVVIGGGPVGVLIASVARNAGAEVVVVETDHLRRERIAALGFEVLDPSSNDVRARITEWTESAGADVVFEVAGAPAAILSATGLLKVRGTLVVVAIHPNPQPVDLQRVFWRELTILGARVYQRTDFEEAARLLADDVIPVEAIISTIIPLDGAPQLSGILHTGGVMKVLFDATKGDDSA